MKKELGTFKRTIRGDYIRDWIVVLLLIVLFLVFKFVYFMLAASSYTDTTYVLNGIFEIGKFFFIIWVVIFVILIIAIPPDFEYNMMEDADCILFEFSDGTRRVISKSFEISKKKLYSLVLKDKEIKKTIEIPYNRKVLETLKEIQKN